jgi:WD40 repeat protein
LRWLSGHTKDVRAVAYTPDGRLVSGGSDRTVRVWNPTTGENTTTIKTGRVVYVVAVSADGDTLAYAGRYPNPGDPSNTVRLWDLATDRADGGYAWRLRWPASIWSLSFSADGQYLAAACRPLGGGNIPAGGGGHCWRRVEPFADFPLPGDEIYAVAFAPSGRRLVVTRENAVHFLPDPETTQGIIYRTPALWAPAVAFVPGRDLAVIASGGFLFFANPARHEKLVKVKTGIRTVTAVAASPGGNTLLAGGKPGTVEVYDVDTRTRTTTYDFGIGGVHAVAFAPDGLTFAVAGDKGLVVCDAAG